MKDGGGLRGGSKGKSTLHAGKSAIDVSEVGVPTNKRGLCQLM